VAADSHIEELLRLLGATLDRESFVVSDTRSIGGTYQGDARPFLMGYEERDSEERAEAERILGWAASSDIGLAAMCNGPEDHRILAEIALWLAERLAGYIDLGGDLSFPTDLPGKVFHVPYAIDDGSQGWCTVVDAPALRAWLRCPQFEMIK
jgi:hypothetical protein